MPESPTRVGLVGAGYFARFHQDAWLRLSGAELVAVCDADESRLRSALADVPGGQGFSTLGQLLDQVDVDLIDLATPPQTHLELVKQAARAGKTIICQKPLAPSLGEARELVAVAESLGVTLVVHENFRFTPWHREMRRLLDLGQLGEVYGASMRMRPGDGQGPRAYLSRQPYFQAMPRFLVHETGIHWIDTFRYLLGEATGVYASLRRLNPHIAGEDSGRILFDFASGATGLLDGNRLVDHSADDPRLTMGEMWLEGSAGAVRLDGWARLWWKPHGEVERPHPYECPTTGFAGDCVLATQAHVLEHLAGRGELENAGGDYLRNLEIEEAVYASSSGRAWISLD